MKTKPIKWLLTCIIVLLMGVTTLFAQALHTGKGEVIAVRFLELKADVDTVHLDTLRYQSTGQQASPGAEALKNCFHYSS